MYGTLITQASSASTAVLAPTPAALPHMLSSWMDTPSLLKITPSPSQVALHHHQERPGSSATRGNEQLLCIRRPRTLASLQLRPGEVVGSDLGCGDSCSDAETAPPACTSAAPALRSRAEGQLLNAGLATPAALSRSAPAAVAPCLCFQPANSVRPAPPRTPTQRPGSIFHEHTGAMRRLLADSKNHLPAKSQSFRDAASMAARPWPAGYRCSP